MLTLIDRLFRTKKLTGSKMRRLIVVPSDPLSAYEAAGYEHLEAYYNPLGFFDETIIMSPFEPKRRIAYGMQVIPVKAADFPRALRKYSPDIVRAYGGYWPSDFVCNNRVDGIPVVVSVHDKRLEMIYASMCKADAVFCVSEAVVHAVQSVGVVPERIRLLPNRVDMHRFRPCRDVSRSAELDRLFPGGKHILFVGRKSEEKNLDTVIKSLRYLAEDVVVIFIGQGNETSYRALAMSEGVSARCHWVDHVKNTELPYWYSWGDCLCVPSRSEGFGIVFIEALACGCAVVTTDAPPMNAFLKHGETAHLVKQNEDPVALAEALEKVCYDDVYRNRLVKGGLCDTETFSRSRIDALEVGFYRELVESRSG